MTPDNTGFTAKYVRENASHFSKPENVIRNHGGRAFGDPWERQYPFEERSICLPVSFILFIELYIKEDR